MSWRLLKILAIALGSCVPAVLAQTVPFQLQIQQGSNAPFTVNNNSTLNLVANGIGQTLSVSVMVTYAGKTQAQINASAQLVGSPAFTVGPIAGSQGTVSQSGSLTLLPGNSVAVQLTFTPTSGAQATAQLTIPYLEAPATAGQPSVAGTITLNFTGSTPQFSVSYSFASNNNVVPLANGGALSFPAIPVNTFAVATVNVVNIGGGAGNLDSISVTGGAFQINGLGLLPATIASGSGISFQVQYSPLAVETDQGTLQIKFDAGTFTAQLQGSAVLSNFSYSLINGTSSTTITPGQTVALPSVPVGQQSTFTVQVQNVSAATITASLISISGAGFGLVDVPPLPLPVVPSGGFTVEFSFTPAQPGAATGRLRIGNDVFTFTSSGLGPQLVYSYVSGGTSVTVPASGTVVFSPVAVGQSALTAFTVQNTGTAAATISSVAVNTPAAVFTLQSVPAVPLTLPPNGSVTFQIDFAPVTTGQTTGTLLINSQQFALLGSANQPPPLPSFQFTGPSGQVSPFSQVSIGLTLAQPYSIPLSGTFTLAVSSASFVSDPAVRFSSGGQSSTFTIPANQTQAIFANGSTQIGLQTGTVAGTIVITPAFTTYPGNVNLTPANVPQLSLVVPQQAPQLLVGQLVSSSSTGFSISVTGFSTTRSLSKLNIQVTPVTGVTFSSNQFSLDVSEISSLWFAGSASQSFGGQFTVTIPFTLSSTSSSTATTAGTKIQSVTVSATNGVGTSGTVTININ